MRGHTPTPCLVLFNQRPYGKDGYVAGFVQGTLNFVCVPTFIETLGRLAYLCYARLYAECLARHGPEAIFEREVLNGICITDGHTLHLAQGRRRA